MKGGFSLSTFDGSMGGVPFSDLFGDYVDQNTNVANRPLDLGAEDTAAASGVSIQTEAENAGQFDAEAEFNRLVELEEKLADFNRLNESTAMSGTDRVARLNEIMNETPGPATGEKIEEAMKQLHNEIDLLEAEARPVGLSGKNLEQMGAIDDYVPPSRPLPSSDIKTRINPETGKRSGRWGFFMTTLRGAQANFATLNQQTSRCSCSRKRRLLFRSKKTRWR